MQAREHHLAKPPPPPTRGDYHPPRLSTALLSGAESAQDQQRVGQHTGADHPEAGLERGLPRVAILDVALARRQHDRCPAMTWQVSGDLPAGLRAHLDGRGKATNDHEDTPHRVAIRGTGQGHATGLESTRPEF
jgi:hypothetical protein